MQRPSITRGLIIAVLASAAFGTSGAIAKALLESGWSPAAAVTARAVIAGIVLLPLALIALRGRWDSVWRARWRIVPMALVGVAGTQLLYFAAVARIPVSTAILIELMAPILLVVVAWARLRRTPKAVVLIGSVAAIVGLVLVVSPSGGHGFDLLGYLFAAAAMVGCAVYFVIAAKPSDGLPPVAFASFSLLIGGGLLGLVGATGIVPLTATFVTVDLFGGVAWWVPLLILAVFSTAFAYAASITATEIIGSRLGSFMGLLEVVFASVYAWLFIGEALTWQQILGGLIIITGIGLVRAEKREQVATPIEPIPLETGPLEVLGATPHDTEPELPELPDLAELPESSDAQSTRTGPIHSVGA